MGRPSRLSSTRKSCSTDVAGPHLATGSSSRTLTTRTTGTGGRRVGARRFAAFFFDERTTGFSTLRARFGAAPAFAAAPVFTAPRRAVFTAGFWGAGRELVRAVDDFGPGLAFTGALGDALGGALAGGFAVLRFTGADATGGATRARVDGRPSGDDFAGARPDDVARLLTVFAAALFGFGSGAGGVRAPDERPDSGRATGRFAVFLDVAT